MSKLKNLGAALMIDELEPHIKWLIDGKCDLEIQDFFQRELLEGDWQSKVAEAKKLLDGCSGRMGIHGPFWGLSLANPDSLLREVIKKRFMQGLIVAEELGATHMVIHSPVDPWMHRSILNNKEEKDRIISYFA